MSKTTSRRSEADFLPVKIIVRQGGWIVFGCILLIGMLVLAAVAVFSYGFDLWGVVADALKSWIELPRPTGFLRSLLNIASWILLPITFFTAAFVVNSVTTFWAPHTYLQVDSSKIQVTHGRSPLQQIVLNQPFQLKVFKWRWDSGPDDENEFDPDDEFGDENEIGSVVMEVRQGKEVLHLSREAFADEWRELEKLEDWNTSAGMPIKPDNTKTTIRIMDFLSEKSENTSES